MGNKFTTVAKNLFSTNLPIISFLCFNSLHSLVLLLFSLTDNHCIPSECSLLQENVRESHTAWKVSVFGVSLVRIFAYLEWIQRDTEYLSVFSRNAGKYGPEKLQIRTFFTQDQTACKDCSLLEATLQSCSLENLFLKYAPNLLENTHAKRRFQLSCFAILLKLHTSWVFSYKFAAYFVTLEDGRSIIKTLKNNKAAGGDTPLKLLKECDFTYEKLINSINNSLSEGLFPDSLKKSKYFSCTQKKIL